MITSFDDYCIHQTDMPIAHPAQSDPNHYDRYWFSGMHRKGDYFFEIGLGAYPNRYVMDGHFSVVVDGTQHSFHGSCRCPEDRIHTDIGPMSLKIEEPMRQVRVSISKNSTNIECNLLFRAATAPTEEPQNILHEDKMRKIMHNSRFTQFGAWEGWFSVNGKRVEVTSAENVAMRDKSWGVRPVGGSSGGAPPKNAPEPRVYWAWSPTNFGDVATQFGTFEDADGQATQLSGCIVPVYSKMADIPPQEVGHVEMRNIKHQIKWLKGTRRPEEISIEFENAQGKTENIHGKAISHFFMCGIGYQHAKWGHGVWHGEEKIAGESWDMKKVDQLDFSFIHVHTLLNVKMGQREGVGLVETVVYGAHKPSGFKEFLDGAS